MKEEPEKESESEFGKGLCYCLGLFLAHAGRDWFKVKNERKSELDKTMELMEGEMWFNAASDHLYNLQVDAAPEKLRDRIKIFQDLCLNWGHGFPEKKATKEDVKWAIQEAKDLLRIIDESNEIITEKGQWE